MSGQEHPGFITEADLEVGLRRVLDIGNRFAGTRGEALAREFVSEQMAEMGLENVREEEVPFLSYECEAATCTIESHGDRDQPAVAPLQFTANGVGVGEPIYIGSGQLEDIDWLEARGASLEGRVVVAESPYPFFTAPLLSERRPAAFIQIAGSEDTVAHGTATLYPGALEPPWTGRVLDFPGVTIAPHAGRRLVRAICDGSTRVTVEHSCRYHTDVTANVLGEIPGSRFPNERVIIGGHYDSQLDGPGAWDNGVGLAAVLAIARAWRVAERTLVFAAWAAEETGLWGSANYVKAHGDQCQTILGVVNVDAPGSPLPGPRTLIASKAIARFAAESSARAGWKVERVRDAAALPYGDYAPFVDVGVPACQLAQFPPLHPYYHSRLDTLRYVDVVRAMSAANASGQIAWDLAQVEGREELTTRPDV